MDITSLTIPELRQKLSTGALKPREVVDQLATRVEAVDPKLKAYLHLDLARSSRGGRTSPNPSLPLGGVPIADQGRDQREGRSVHLRVEDFAGLRRALRRDRHHKAARSRGGLFWSHEYG